MILALLLAAATPQPFLEMSAGPMWVHESGRTGVGTGPLVRLDVGYPFGDRFAGELWIDGAMESAPQGALSDRALVAAGAGARFLLGNLGSDGTFGLWAHGGAGWGTFAAGEGIPGPTGFAGLMFSFQPFVKRFNVGLEADAVGWRRSFGVAVLPSLRCRF
jgi:hypothetical protein